MKKRFLIVLTTLLFVFVLTACGNDQKQDSQNSQEENTASDSITGNGSGSNSSGSNGSNSGGAITGSDGAASGTGGASDSSGDTIGDMLFGEDSSSGDATASSSARTMGASYEQMLRNARVHDTDGDLSDLENDYTPGSLGW